MASGFWSAGDTNVLASRGMNQDQSGWDSLQSWYDEKAKREREAARLAAIQAASEEERQNVAQARSSALESSGLERFDAVARAQGIDESALTDRVAQADAKLAEVEVAPTDTAPSFSVTDVMADRDQAASLLDRFKTGREKVKELAKKGQLYVSNEGEAYSTPEAYLFEKKVGYEGKKKRTAEEVEAAKIKRQTELDAEAAKNARKMMAKAYSPEEIESVMADMDLAKENQRIVDEMAKVKSDSAEGKALAAQHAALTQVADLFNKNADASRLYSLSYMKKAGADLEKAQGAFDRAQLDTREDVLGIQADQAEIDQLEQSAMRMASMDPGSKYADNVFGQAGKLRESLKAKIDQYTLRRMESKDRNLSSQVNSSRTTEYLANQLQTKAQLAKAGDEIKLALQRLKNAGMLADQSEENRGKIIVEQIRQATSGNSDATRIQSARIAAAGFIAGVAKEKGLETAQQLFTLFPTGQLEAGQNAAGANQMANTYADLERNNMVTAGAPRFEIKQGFFRDGKSVSPGDPASNEASRRAKEKKKSAALPFDPQRIATLDAMVASGKVKRSVSGDVATYSLPSGRVYNFKTR